MMSSYTYNPDTTYNNNNSSHLSSARRVTFAIDSSRRKKTPRHLLYLTLLSALIVYGYDTVLEPFVFDITIDEQYNDDNEELPNLGEFSPEADRRLKRLGRRKRRALEQRVS